MKKILYIIGVLLTLVSCNRQVDEPANNGANPDGTFTFNLTLDEPLDENGQRQETRATVQMARYILEMYEGNLNATPQRMNNTTGTFNVSLKNGTDYVCLFWADNGTGYNATSLKAVKQTDETKLGTAAYCTKVTVNSKTFNGAIMLKRAVAELSFVDKSGLTEATNKLTITYPYASATLNVGDGTVAHAQGAAVRTIDGIVPPAQSVDAFATDFVLAPTAAGVLDGLKFQLNAEAEKTIPQTAIQANYRTKISGEYQGPEPFMSLTIDTRKNTDDASGKTFILPLNAILSGYSLTVDWGDSNIEKFVNGTELNQANMTHTYAAAGVYTITISSSQKDYSKAQMPSIRFLNYEDVNKNSIKLISIDTPLLNMGTDLSRCFIGCTSLTSIPATLFENNIATTCFSLCFYDCTGLTSIPATLFEKNIATTDFDHCFYGCTGLTSIPATLFEKNTVAIYFLKCFNECTALTEIPATLFEKNTAATNFNNCFYGCTALTEIPVTLFEKNTAATDFWGCFYGCNALTSIPATLFEKNTAVTDFGYCFSSCEALTSIPATLFEKNTVATDFTYCFSGCNALTSIPATLFEKNTAATNFRSCFSSCEALTSIPATLFEKNTAATNFSYCFANCTALTSMPAGLFAKNTLATDFKGCFINCSKLTLNANIFCKETDEKTTRFAGKTMNFDNCFSDCGSNSSIGAGAGGTAPALWSYTMEAGSTKAKCFRDVTKVTNVADIPDEWK